MRADLWAGLAGAVVVLPQGVAFATLAGMPPQYGLYAAIVPTLVAALFGSSRLLVAGPSTTASLVLFAALSPLETPGTPRYVELALTLAFMAGLIEMALGVFRWGALVNFVSHTVVVAYTAAVGVLIMVSQIPNLLRLEEPPRRGLAQTLLAILQSLPQTSLATAATALATLAVGLSARRFLKGVPYLIPAVVAGALVGAIFNFVSPGVVATIGALPAGLPPLSAPSFKASTWVLLAPAALAIAISALNEVVSIGRILAARTDERINIDQEFIGQGLANLTGSLFSSYVVSGSFNRSALNAESGARSQLAAVFAAGLLALALLFVAPLTAYLPKPTMAASLVVIGWSLIDRASLTRIWRAGDAERGVMGAVVVVALFVQVQAAILAGAALSLLVYLYRTSNPQLRPRVPERDVGERKFVDPGPEHPECPQFRLARLDGSLYFGAVNAFRDALAALEADAPGCRHFGIIMRGVNFIDLAGAEALALEARRLRAAGGGLHIVNIKENPYASLQRGGYVEEIGADRFFTSKTKAISDVYGKLDYSICRGCSRRVFRECPQHDASSG